jgi:hypothetical protein
MKPAMRHSSRSVELASRRRRGSGHINSRPRFAYSARARRERAAGARAASARRKLKASWSPWRVVTNTPAPVSLALLAMSLSTDSSNGRDRIVELARVERWRIHHSASLLAAAVMNTSAFHERRKAEREALSAGGRESTMKVPDEAERAKPS